MRKQNPKEYKHCMKVLKQYFGNNKRSNSLLKRLLNKAFGNN